MDADIRRCMPTWPLAFPEHQPLVVVHDRIRAIERLQRLLTPLTPTRVPHWHCWFPGEDRSLITQAIQTGPTRLWLPPYEHELARIAAYKGTAAAYAWVYVETSPADPSEHSFVQEDPDRRTFFAPRTRVHPRLLQPRRRRANPSNFLILPVWTQLTKPTYAGPLMVALRRILLEDVSLQTLCEATTLITAVDQLPVRQSTPHP